MAHDPVNVSALPQPYFRRTATQTLSASTTSAVTADLDLDFDSSSPHHHHHPPPTTSSNINNEPTSVPSLPSHPNSNSSLTRTRCVRLHLAARDVPEPDVRSHTSYAVLYYAREVPVDDTKPDHNDDHHQVVGVDLRHTSAVTSSTADPFQLPFEDDHGGGAHGELNGVMLHEEEEDDDDGNDGSGRIRMVNNNHDSGGTPISHSNGHNSTATPMRRSRQPFAFLTKQRSVTSSRGRKTHSVSATSSRQQSYNHPSRQPQTYANPSSPNNNSRPRSAPHHQQQQRRPQRPSSPQPPTSHTHPSPSSPLRTASAPLGPRYRDRFVPSVGEQHQHSQHYQPHHNHSPRNNNNNNNPQPPLASPNAALNRHATDGYARSRPSSSSRAESSSSRQGNILTPFFKLGPHARTLGRAPEHALPRVASPDRTEVVEHPAPSPRPRRSINNPREGGQQTGGGDGIPAGRHGRHTVSAGMSGTLKTAMTSTSTTTTRSRIKPSAHSQSPPSAAAPITPSPPRQPTSVKYVRSGWTRIGTTELARKHGRDVEFARTVTLQFRVCDRVVVRACVFDGSGRRRLVGTADFYVSAAYAADGKRIFSPLSFVAVNKADKRKKKKTPHGTLVVVAQRLPRVDGPVVNGAELNKPPQQGVQRQSVNMTKMNTVMMMKEEKFRLDVECGRILRATALSVSVVKRLFYTIHAVLDRKDELSDSWTLLFRSDPVEMIHTKRDGGSMQKNYFSGVRLRAMPAGDGLDHHRPSSRHEQQGDGNENGNENTDAIQQRPTGISSPKAVAHVSDNIRDDDDGGGLFAMFGKMLGVTRPKLFFSLPGADLLLLRDDTRLKLSVWEDNGTSAGFDLVADTLFTMADLKRRELGESSAIKVHANVVGKAILKYVECSPDPHYFCLSLRMQNIQ